MEQLLLFHLFLERCYSDKSSVLNQITYFLL